MTQTVPAAAALQSVPPGSHVVATMGCATPETLLAALAERAAVAPGITLSSGLLLGSHPFCDAVAAGVLRYRTWHVTASTRSLVASGAAEYLPVRASDVPPMLSEGVDAVLLRVSPPDRHGYCSLGPSGSYARAAMSGASTVLAEIDPDLPRTFGDTAVHVSELRHVVDADTPTPLYESAPRTDASDRIAAFVVDLVPKNATVQVGIGSIPEAVVAGLGEADLGTVHMAGMACDRMVPLFECGRLRRSDVVPEPAVNAVELFGTRQLLDFADGNPSIAVIPSTTCHDPRWLATLPRFVSINSAVEIDLSGQVGSEVIGGRTMSGIGGSVDFFQGATWSEGGVRVIAMQSTTPDGSISKIVSQLAAGTPVTVPRHAVDYVVTEHGVARLAGRSLRERAEALTAIADPRFRDELSSFS